MPFRAFHCHSVRSPKETVNCHFERSPKETINCHSERSPEETMNCHSERSEESADPALSCLWLFPVQFVQLKFKTELWHSILHECCPFVGNVFYLCGCRVTGRHTDESVFILSFQENVVVFNIRRTTDGTHHSCRLCGKGILYPLFPHIYPSVEYWTSFIPDTGSTTTFLKIDEIGSTLSFCAISSIGAGLGYNNLLWMML